jgi:hypothetical protein
VILYQNRGGGNYVSLNVNPVLGKDVGTAADERRTVDDQRRRANLLLGFVGGKPNILMQSDEVPDDDLARILQLATAVDRNAFTE